MLRTNKFLLAKERLTSQIRQSKSEEDLSHAENTMHWVNTLQPNAGELLLLAGFGHDVERSLSDRYRHTDFPTYDDYKRAHAARSGQIVSEIMQQSGFSAEESARVAHIIAEGEFNSDDPDIQLLCDADSISFFDNNLSYYIKDKGEPDTRKKMSFMYDRSSELAKKHIRSVLRTKPQLNLIGI